MRVVYNVTVSVDPEIAEDWANWMQEKHIPEVMQTGAFAESRFCKINGEEEGVTTYATTYIAHSQEALDEYAQKFAPALQADHKARFEGRFAAFRTTLNELAVFKHEG